MYFYDFFNVVVVIHINFYFLCIILYKLKQQKVNSFYSSFASSLTLNFCSFFLWNPYLKDKQKFCWQYKIIQYIKNKNKKKTFNGGGWWW